MLITKVTRRNLYLLTPPKFFSAQRKEAKKRVTNRNANNSSLVFRFNNKQTLIGDIMLSFYKGRQETTKRFETHVSEHCLTHQIRFFSSRSRRHPRRPRALLQFPNQGDASALRSSSISVLYGKIYGKITSEPETFDK